MISRDKTTKALFLLRNFPVLTLLGSRQVGKTTLAKTIAKKINKPSIYFDLENERDLHRFEMDAQSLLEEHIDKLVIIDEVQRMPKLFSLLRHLVDIKRKPSRFLLLGSASPELLKGVTESLAGRVSYLELFPIDIIEATTKKITKKKHWMKGGYPEALLAKSDKVAMQWMDDYIKSYIERDLSVIYQMQLPTNTIKSFWKMLASSNGSVWNAESYSRSLGISNPTVTKYLNLLEGAFLIFRLQPWFVNVKKRVIKSPKIYVTDSGILHRLNSIDSYEALQNNIIVGASWEGYVIQQIRDRLPSGLELFFYRTQNGAECDLVLVKGNKPIAICEIKISETPTISRGFFECINDLKSSKNYIITPSKESFTNKSKGIIFCGLEYFLTQHLPRIDK